MWKLLRNLVLAAVLLAGILKLLAWYVAGQVVQRAVVALEPYAQIQYDGLTAGLDGSVGLSDMRVAPKGAHRIYRADYVIVDSPGLLWLLGHALTHDTTLPAQLGITATGLSLPPEPWLNPLWLDSTRFTLFPSAGCASQLGAADFQRMGIHASAPAQERLAYHYNPDRHSLDATLSLSAPGFAALALEAQLSRFEPATSLTRGFLDKAHADQLSASYTDLGFARQRARYCAAAEHLPLTQFADRHIAAVRALLQQDRIQPGDEVQRLYRTLVLQGGQMSVLSLPNPGFTPSAWDAIPRDELLRQLNVTARYQDRPPVMLRLTFSPAPEIVPTTTAAPANVPPNVSPSNLATALVAPVSAQPKPPAPVATRPPVDVAPAPAVAAHATPVTTADKPAPIPAATQTPNPRPQEPLPLPHLVETPNYLDRAEARLPQPQNPQAASEPEIHVAPLAPLAASASGPTSAELALIWKPGLIEPLPETAPQRKDYSVVDFSRLPELTGRHVRLITLGSKNIEGFVVSADANGVQVRVIRAGGDAVFALARNRVTQVQLLRW